MILDGAKIKANASVKQSKNADALDKENDCIIVLPVSRLHLKGFKKEKMNLI
ncbi:MAG: hypothetical protein J5U19_07585 [Candidatus Methanoperedens sp.]|nr:hypothetical protein [Candidatus Methanoperedens sp.]